MTISIPLISRKAGPAPIGHLNYQRLPLDKAQARLVGRYALKPEIDLNDYSCRAVIDWIIVGFWLGKETQHQWVQPIIQEVFGEKAWTELVDEQPGRVTDKFDITFQEPNLLEVRSFCQRLEAKFGFKTVPVIRAAEISVDFRPDRPDDVARAKLHTALTRHFWTARDVMSRGNSKIRFYPNARGATERIVAYSSKQPEAVNERFLLSTEYDVAPLVDATYYAGAKSDEVMWRVQDKIIDKQNRKAGTALVLAEADQRVRIEVTLKEPEVSALGVVSLDDLQRLRFSTLQGRFFKFMLPTFPDDRKIGATMRAAIEAGRSRQRIEKFQKTGVIGLAQMDRVLDSQRKAIRKASVRHMASQSLVPKPVARTGAGITGHLVAYEELNERIHVALRHLGERVADDFSTLA